MHIQLNKAGTDPRIIVDMWCKAKQTLVDLYNNKSTNILAKSLSELINKVN
jgi:methylaspartate ammonia-lyase